MRHPLSSLRTAIVLAVASAAPGCSQLYLEPVLPMPMRVVSPTPFRVEVPRQDGTPADTCFGTAAEGTVDAIRTDTLWFVALRVTNVARGRDCAAGRAAFILLADAPQLSTEYSVVERRRSAVAAIFIVPQVAIILAFLFWPT